MDGVQSELILLVVFTLFAYSSIFYLSDSVGLKPGWLRPDMGSLMGMAGRLILPFGLLRDSKKGCGSVSPFAPILGYGSARGYRYDLPKAGEQGKSTSKGYRGCNKRRFF